MLFFIDEVNNLSIGIVNLLQVVVDVDGRGGVSHVVSESGRNGLLWDVEFSRYGRPCVPAPILGYIREEGSGGLLSSVSLASVRPDVFESLGHLPKEVLVRLVVADVEKVVLSLVLLDKSHRLRLHLDGIEFTGLGSCVLESSVTDGIRLRGEEVYSVDSAQVEHQHEHIPIYNKIVIARIVTQSPELLDSERPLSCLLSFEFELTERIVGGHLFVYRRVEYRTDVAEVHIARCLLLLAFVSQPIVEVLKILDVNLVECLQVEFRIEHPHEFKGESIRGNCILFVLRLDAVLEERYELTDRLLLFAFLSFYLILDVDGSDILNLSGYLQCGDCSERVRFLHIDETII